MQDSRRKASVHAGCRRIAGPTIYPVPLDGEPFGIVHPGIAARIAHRGVDGNHTRTAYIDAMVEWQDELWRATGQPHGLLRIGNARARLSRIEFAEREKSTKAAADAKVIEEQANTRRRKLEADERLLQIRAKSLADAMQHLEMREARFTEESAGTVTKGLAAAELALIAANQKNLGLEAQLADARYRNAEHERLAQAAGRRDSEGVPVEIRQRTPKR